MTMKRQIVFFMLMLSVFGQIFASVDGIIGVISPRVMYDGRPVLWQNLQSDSAVTAVQFFQGERYNFFGLIIGEDSSRVYAGLNTAGFGIVFSSEMTADDNSETMLIQKALGLCGRLDDFTDLLAQSTAQIDDNSSFACMDAFGGITLFEAGVNALEPFDLKTSPNGFLVRANFNFYQPQTADEGYWRYHRATELFEIESHAGLMHHHNVVKKVARDLESRTVQPYPLPSEGRSASTPDGYIECKNSINQSNTVSCVVLHGVRNGENPDFATMWVVLGEPISGVAVPLWPATTHVPPECQVSDVSLNRLFRNQENFLYDRPDMPSFLNTQALVENRAQFNPIENIVFAETRKALARWRTQNEYLQDMIDFQMATSTHVFQSLSK